MTVLKTTERDALLAKFGYGGGSQPVFPQPDLKTLIDDIRDTVMAVRHTFTFPMPAGALTANTLADFLTDFVAGGDIRLIKWAWVTKVALAGAGGTLTFQLQKGAAAIAGDLVVPLASGAVGQVISQDLSGANAILTPADQLSIVRLATGTAFTSGEGEIIITCAPYLP
jgi:hypothetical protein